MEKVLEPQIKTIQKQSEVKESRKRTLYLPNTRTNESLKVFLGLNEKQIFNTNVNQRLFKTYDPPRLEKGKLDYENTTSGAA